MQNNSIQNKIIASGGLEPFFHVVDELVAGRQAVLSVVVDTQGSTPQVIGAMISNDLAGRVTGTVGGGCLEAAVKNKANRLLFDGGAIKYSLTLDHDPSVRDGMICGGTLSVVSAMISPDLKDSWVKARDMIKKRENAQITLSIDNEGKTEEFCITLGLKPRLFIAGAGHVGIELAWLADRIDFDVTMIDDRADMLVKDRFPSQVSTKRGIIDEVLAQTDLTEKDYVVIATRGHRDDLDCITGIINKKLTYLGMLGSKKKIITIFNELRHRGAEESFLDAINTPIGLSINSQTPAEIAVSIAAEIIAVRRAV